MATITSAQTGNWETSSTWVGGVEPGDGDIAILAHAITLDGDITVGTNVAGTDAITIQSSGSLTVTGGVTLRCKGDVNVQATSLGALTIEAGCKLYMEGDEVYDLIFPSQYPGVNPAVVVRGTALSRAAIGLGTGSTVSHMLIRGSATFHTLIDAEYCDFNDIGTSSIDCMTPSLPSFSGSEYCVFRLVNCSFTNCGRLNLQGASGAWTQITLQNTSFKTSAGTYCLRWDLADSLDASAVRIIDQCVFDKEIELFSATDLTINNECIFQQGFVSAVSGEWAEFRNNFVGKDNRAPTTTHGSVTGGYWIKSDAAAVNPHNMQFAAGLGNQTANGTIYEYVGSDSDGDCNIIPSPSSAATYTFRNCIFLPNADGENSGTLLSALGNANVTLVIENNTCFIGGAANQGGVTVGETYAGHAGQVSSCRGNIFYNKNPSSGYAMEDSGTDDTVVDLIASANLDYNCVFGALAGTNGGGYDNLEFSSGSPGTNDVSSNPNFVNEDANIASWDASLGGPGTTANAIAELAKRNDSDFDPNRTVANLVAYIQAAMTPTNAALKGTSFDGGDIGAVPVVLQGGQDTEIGVLSDKLSSSVNTLVGTIGGAI